MTLSEPALTPTLPELLLGQGCPCPYDCKGRLLKIALLEAVGCFECQQLFVFVEEGKAIAKPAAHPWTRTQWYWTERGWYRSDNGWWLSPMGVALLVVGLVFGGGLICLFLPALSIGLCLGLLGAAAGLLLLLNLVTLLSFRS